MPTPCRLSLGQCSYRPPSPPAAIPPSPRDGNFVPLRHYKGSDHGGTNGHSEENNQESRVPMPICDSNTQNQKRKKYNCEQCQKAFDHTPDLRHHMRMHEPQRRERTLVRHGFDKHPAHAAKIHVHRTVIVVTVMICIHIMRNYGECHRRALRGNTRWKAFELQMILRHEPSWLVCPDPLLLLAACMAFVGLMQLWYELHNQDDLQTWIMSASFITGLAIGGFLGHSLIFTALTVLPSALCLGLLLSHALHRLWGWRSHGKRGTVYPNLVEDVMDDDSAWSKAEKKDLSDDEIDKHSDCDDDRDGLTRRIMQRASGVFLWVVLACRLRCTRPMDMEMASNDIERETCTENHMNHVEEMVRQSPETAMPPLIATSLQGGQNSSVIRF